MSINTSRFPAGDLAMAKLVDDVIAGDDRAERHYLEIKGDIDPTSKEGSAKIAKFILGAANRMPDVAARAFDGHALMVLGIRPSGVHGFGLIEMMDIARGIEPFLTAAGPKWDLRRVPVDGTDREVLIIVVEPPEWGQDAFICFKNGAGVADGHVYLRADGETRQAKSDELVQLRLRAKPAMPSIELRVTADEPATHIVCDPATTRDQFVVAVRNARDQARRDAEPASTPQVGLRHPPRS